MKFLDNLNCLYKDVRSELLLLLNYLSKSKCILNGATKIRTKTEIQKKEIDLKNNKKVFLEYNVISTTTGKIN